MNLPNSLDDLAAGDRQPAGELTEFLNRYSDLVIQMRRTKVSLADLIRLERLSTELLLELVELYRADGHLKRVTLFLEGYHDIKVDAKTLARYWRFIRFKKFTETEEEFRIKRITERAEKKSRLAIADRSTEVA